MWFLWIIAVLLAFYVKGLCGFANTLILTSIVSFGEDNINISPVELILAYPANLVLAFRNRKGLKPGVVIPLSVMVLAGSTVGAFLLKNINVDAVKIIFGVVIILLGVEMLLRERAAKKAQSSKALLLVIGIVSGVLCGLFGIGALLAAYVDRVTDNHNDFKANLNAVFLVEATFRIVLYSILGIITWSTLKMSLILMPVMLVGLFAGIKSADVMDEKLIKKIVIVLLIITGISMVIMTAVGMA